MEQERPHDKRRLWGVIGVPIVQIVACAVVILIVLLIRLVSGNLFSELGAYFEQAMRENSLADAVDALWGDMMEYKVTEDPAAAESRV